MSDVNYPNTKLTIGEEDPPFGGVAANRFGTPQRTFQDAQIRELERQTIDNTWTGRPVQYLTIQTSGIAGDAIVFDTALDVADGTPAYRTLVSTGYDALTTPIIGWLLQPVSAGEVAPVCEGGGVLSPSVSGLSGESSGPITVDTTDGRLRARAIGEDTFGYCDKNGHAHVFALGRLP